ncbi:MAG: DUF2169 domain-containing protein [Rhodocyclaceae bacterium]|nr:DUF2169 domain-containing protein [Rhodocyclaceae bacterium]
MNGPDNLLDAPVHAAAQPAVTNHTAYPSQYFQMLDVGDKPFHVMVSRVTYDMCRADSAGRLMPAEVQGALVESDQFVGEPNWSTLVQESDFAPFKPRCDLIFAHAVAHAPAGRPARRWPIGVRVGGWMKRLTVTGPRLMERGRLGGWKLDEPEAAARVPISYPLAWGGRCQWPPPAAGDCPEPEIDLYEPTNPLGRGFAPQEWLKRSRVADIDAPQIEAFGQPFDGGAAKRQHYPVVGLGAVGRWWQPRLARAGTYDEDWRHRRWPSLPLDFDFAYWNCAPDDQQIDYPKGGEDVVMVGLHEEGDIRFPLPDPGLKLLLHLSAGVPAFKPMNTDTVIFDMAQLLVVVVQRAVVPAAAGVRAIELGTWDYQAARRDNAERVSRLRARAIHGQ